MFGHDLFFAGYERPKGFAVTPRVLSTLHRLRLIANLILISHCAFEQIGVPFREANPFGLALEETEVTPRTRPPLVVFGQSYPGVLEYAHDVVFGDAIFLEREHWVDVRLVGDIAFSMLIGADGDVAISLGSANPLFEGLDLHGLRAPPHLGARERSLVHPQPVV